MTLPDCDPTPPDDPCCPYCGSEEFKEDAAGFYCLDCGQSPEDFAGGYE